MFRVLSRVTLAVVTLLVLVSTATGTEYFVDFDATPGSDCSDAGPGTDPQAGGVPWCTMPGTRHAIYDDGFLPGPWRRIHAGDTISIKAGSTHTSAGGFGGVLVSARHYDDGTPAARIVIRKHPTWGTGGYAAIDGTGMVVKTIGLVTVLGTDYVTVTGLEVFGSPAIGLDVELDAHHVIIDGAYVHHCSGVALVMLSGCTTSPCMQIVRNSIVAYTATSGGIFVYDNPGGYVLIERNEIHHVCARDTAIDGIQCSGPSGSTSYCAIRGNVVHNHGTFSGYPGCSVVSDPISSGGAGCHHNALVEGNQIYDSSGHFLVHSPWITCDQWGVQSHNVVRGNQLTNVVALTYTAPNDSVFYNNTFYNPAVENIVDLWAPEPATAPGTSFGTPAQAARATALGRDVDYGRLTFKNNIMWGQTRYHVLLNGIAGFRDDVRWSSMRFYSNLYSRFHPLYWYANDTDQDGTYYGSLAAYLQSRSTDAPDVGSLFSTADANQVFVDAANRDYRLAPGSLAIDAGTAITHAVGASAGGGGSSLRLIVERASFTDGYRGLFEPDHITIGDCADVAIARVDDRDAAILLTKPCQWKDGDPVNLATQGTAPDLGALETGAPPTDLPTPQPTATVATNVCGDGITRGGEQCDDGNHTDGDCCSSTCTLEASGTACDTDASACTTGRCDAQGTCRHESITCSACEACDPGVGCVAAPRPSCRRSLQPQRDVFQLDTKRTPSLKWAWTNGEATALSEFGDPRVDARYALCVFDDSAVRPRLALRAMTRSGSCGEKPCWKQPNAHSYTYKDPSGSPDGIDTVVLKSGADGTARVSVTGRGADLDVPGLPLTLPIRVQLQSSNGQCWESRHTANDVLRNRPASFKARASRR